MAGWKLRGERIVKKNVRAGQGLGGEGKVARERRGKEREKRMREVRNNKEE